MASHLRTAVLACGGPSFTDENNMVGKLTNVPDAPFPVLTDSTLDRSSEAQAEDATLWRVVILLIIFFCVMALVIIMSNTIGSQIKAWITRFWYRQARKLPIGFQRFFSDWYMISRGTDIELEDREAAMYVPEQPADGPPRVPAPAILAQRRPRRRDTDKDGPRDVQMAIGVTAPGDVYVIEH